MRRTDYRFMAVVALLVLIIYFVTMRKKTVVDLRPLAKDRLNIVTNSKPSSCPAETEERIRRLAEKYSVSVIIFVHSLSESVISQTVYSIISHSDPRLLKEIIIANHGEMDQNKFKVVQAEFKDYEPLIKVMSSSSKTQVKSKLLVGHAAEGNIVVFLDDTVVASGGYLLPLLEAIDHKNQRIVVPAFNYLTQTFTEEPNQDDNKWVFDWNLTIHPFELHFQELSARPETEDYPTIVFDGSAFGLHKSYLEKLGTLKHDMDFLSSIDLSFSTWLCGEGAYIVPCSRIGKVGYERDVEVLSTNDRHKIASHYLAEKYFKIFSKVTKEDADLLESERNSMHINSKLHKKQCTRTFEDLITSQMVRKDLYVPGDDAVGFGRFNSVNKGQCFRQDQSKAFIQKPCMFDYRESTVEMTKSGHLKIGTDCLQVSSRGYIVTDICDETKEEMKWERTKSNQLKVINKDACISHATDPYPENKQRQILMTNMCSDDSKFQKWNDFVWFDQ